MAELFISFSGGESSAYMTFRLWEEWQQKQERVTVVFANTGQENEETLEFVHRCDQEFGWDVVWIEAKFSPIHGEGVSYSVVDYKTADRDGKVFESLIAKHGIPNRSYPQCSERLKALPMERYKKDNASGKYVTAIGIRADEWDRAKDKPGIIYPMIQWGTQKTDVNRFWANMPFRLNLKGYEGNCKACWKKSARKLATIALEHPERFHWTREMEAKYENFVPSTQNRKAPVRFFRENRTVDDIFAIANAPGFIRADDDTLNNVTIVNGTLFNLDEYSGCDSSCEAF